jgi:hypothetical protein
MTGRNRKGGGDGAAPADRGARKARLAEALRANLARRKAQERSRECDSEAAETADGPAPIRNVPATDG